MLGRSLVFASAFCAAAALEIFTEDEWSKGLNGILDTQSIVSIEGEVVSVLSQPTDSDLIADFMLYTRDDLKNYTKISPEDEKSLENIDMSKDLKLIIHGWRNGYDSPLGEKLKEAYLNKYDVNVIVLDWSSRSFKNCVSSRMSVSKVGHEVAVLLDELVDRGFSLDKIHLIGHSLGAHVAGVAGLAMKSGKIARITGLDPAAPMFTLTEVDVLKSESAQFVDVIHTCGYLLGLISPLGHADFYPNRGTPPQPGCGFDYTGECSHSRAYELFADSINSGNMLATQCEDAAAFDESTCSSEPPIPMGQDTPTSARGFYYLNTRGNSPFGRGAPK